MNLFRVLVRGGLVLFALSLSALSAAEWRRIESEDFVVLSDAPEKDLLRFCVNYSAFRTAFNHLFVPPGARPLKRTQILLFRRAKDYEKRVPGGRGGPSIAFVGPLDGAIFLALPFDGDRDAAMSLAFEAETIWALSQLGYSVSTWMSQGTGEVLSSIRVKDGAAVIGMYPDSLYPLPRDQDMLPWETFFATTNQSVQYGLTTAFHSQAWALMHWILLSGPDSREQYRILADSLRTLPSIKAVEVLMSVQAPDLTNEIQRHLKQRKVLLAPFDEAAVRSGFRVVEASKEDLHLAMANLAHCTNDVAALDIELGELARIAPDRPAYKEAMARRLLGSGDLRDAVDMYRAAIDAGSTNPTAFVFSARARLDESSVSGRDEAGTGGANVAEALAEIRRAIELEPGNREAYWQMARAFFLSPEVPPGALEELSKGIGADAASDDLLDFRGHIHSRLGDHEAYLADLRAAAMHPEATVQRRDRSLAKYVTAIWRRYYVDLEPLYRTRKWEKCRALLEACRTKLGGLNLPRDFIRFEHRLAERERWDQLVKLSEERKWQDFLSEADRFLVDFPESRTTEILRTKAGAVRRALESVSTNASDDASTPLDSEAYGRHILDALSR